MCIQFTGRVKKKVLNANIEKQSSVPVSFSVSLTAHLSTFLILKGKCVKPRISCGYKEWGLIDPNKGQSKWSAWTCPGHFYLQVLGSLANMNDFLEHKWLFTAEASQRLCFSLQLTALGLQQEMYFVFKSLSDQKRNSSKTAINIQRVSSSVGKKFMSLGLKWNILRLIYFRTRLGSVCYSKIIWEEVATPYLPLIPLTETPNITNMMFSNKDCKRVYCLILLFSVCHWFPPSK